LKTLGFGSEGISPLLWILLVISVILNFVMAIILRLIGSQMYPFFIVVYVWIAIYISSLTLVLKIHRESGTALIQHPSGLVVLIILALGIRLAFLGLDTYISLDSLWYLDFGKFMLSGKVPYFEFYFPYPPLFAYFIYAVAVIAPVVDSFRIIAILFDMGVILMIWKIASHRTDKRYANLGAIAYAFLPISIIESGWNGHFESLVGFLLLLSLYMLLGSRYRLSGVFLGLAAATKFYPILLFPVGLFYVPNWKNRLEFTLVAILSAATTFVPFLLFSFGSSTSPSNPPSTSTEGFVFTLLYSLFSLSSDRIFFTAFALTGILLGIIIMIRLTFRSDERSNSSSYYWGSLVLGSVLLVMGLSAGLYPLLPIAKLVYWRYPVDVGIVRGISSISIGILILYYSYQGIFQKRKYSPSTESVLLMISFTILLISTITRPVFYGWYLLWAIPVLLLIRDRKMCLTVLLCLLLLYPSYTHDNFTSLGTYEERTWSDEFGSVANWDSVLHHNNTLLNATLIQWSVYSNNSMGIFRFDTSRLNSVRELDNVSLQYTMSTSIPVNPDTDFIARITSDWDPTFGAQAFLSLTYTGFNHDGTPINGSIIPQSSLFTNLTFILWRYSFLSENPDLELASIRTLTLHIDPRAIANASFIIDYFYTTESVLHNPIYYVMIPTLIALSLGSFVILNTELRRIESEN